MIFTLHIVEPKNWPHVKMFIPPARAIAKALRDLGHDVYFGSDNTNEVVNLPPRGRSIVFGANFLPDVPLAEDAILFNTEQVPIDLGKGPGTMESEVFSTWAGSDFMKIYRRHEVWDYSQENIRRLRLLGVERIKHCRFGYSEALVDVPKNLVNVAEGTYTDLSHDNGVTTISYGGDIANVEQDIDVLFYGTFSERRTRILAALNEASVRTRTGTRPLRLAALQGVYGEQLNQYIARAKIVLNLHANYPQYAPAIFEMVRVSHLLSNHKCVVSESGGHDQELEAFAQRATVSASYDKIVEACLLLLDESNGAEASRKIREGIAVQGHSAIREIDQREEVRAALRGIA